MIADTNSIWNICWYIDWNIHSTQFRWGMRRILPRQERAKNYMMLCAYCAQAFYVVCCRAIAVLATDFMFNVHWNERIQKGAEEKNTQLNAALRPRQTKKRIMREKIAIHREKKMFIGVRIEHMYINRWWSAEENGLRHSRKKKQNEKRVAWSLYFHS